MGLPTGKDLYEPEDMSELAHLSGMPAEHANRSVIIAQRWLKTTQQGDKFSNQWQLFWKNSQKWSNPLMGWTSTSDPLSKVKVTTPATPRLLLPPGIFIRLLAVWPLTQRAVEFT